MNSDILNIKVNKTVRLNHNSNSNKMSLNGRLDVSPSLETKISDMQQKFRHVFMSHGQSLSYCNTIIKSINNNVFQKLQEEYKFKMYSFADEINSLKLGLSFSQQLKKIILERQEVIRMLRLELISNRASKQINLATVCEKLDSIRLLTLIILEKIEGCRKKLQVLQSPYFTEILHKLGQDIDFLRISPLRKFIQFSNNQDPLFMVPLRKFWSLGSIASSQRRAIIDLFTINAQYKNRLEASDKFLRLMQKTDKRFESIDHQYSQLIDQLSSQFNSPVRQQKMNTLDKFTLPSVNRNNPVFEQNNRSQKTKQMISSMIKQVVSQYKQKTKESNVFQSPIRNNKKGLSRSIDKPRDVSDRETLNQRFHAKEKNNIKYIIGRTASLRPANIQKNKAQIIKPNKLPQIDHPNRDSTDSKYLQLDQYLAKQIDQSRYSSKLNSNPLRAQDIQIKNHHRKLCGKIRYNQLSSLRGMGRMYTQPTINQNSPIGGLNPKQQTLKTITDEHESRNTYRTESKNVGSRFSEKPRTNNSRSQNVSTPHLIGQRQYQKYYNRQKPDIQNIISRKQKQQEKKQYEISPQFNYSLSKQYNRHQGQFIVHKSISQQKLQRKDNQTSSNNTIPLKAQVNKMRDQDSPSYKFKVSIPPQNSQVYPTSYRNNQSYYPYPSNSQENNKFQSKYQINRIQQDMQAENATSHRTANNMSKNQILSEDDHPNYHNNTNLGKSNQPSLKQPTQKSNRTNGSPQERNDLKETPINISIKKSQNSSGKSSSSQKKTVNQNPKINQQIQKKEINLDNIQNQKQKQLIITSNQQPRYLSQQKIIISQKQSNEQGNNLTNTNKYTQKNEGIQSLNITKRQDQPINKNDVIFQKSSEINCPQQSTSKSIQKIQKDSISNQNLSNNPIYNVQVRNQKKQKNSFGISNPSSNRQDQQVNKKVNYQNSSHNVQNKGKNGQAYYQTAQKNIIDSKANQVYAQKDKLSDSPQTILQNNKKLMPMSSISNIQQKNNPQPTQIISKDSKGESLTTILIPKQSKNSIFNQQATQKEQKKVQSSSSSLEKTINTQKIGQMLKKCTFQSKMTKQKDLYVIIKTLSLSLQNQILEYICQPYFTYRHILTTACIFDNQYCGYCIYYPCIEPNQRTTYILHMQIVKQQFKQLQVALFNTFVRYIFTNDPCQRIIYLKNNRLINKNVVKELKHYESEVKTSIPLIKTQETSYLLDRKDIKCTKDEEYTSIISYISLFISNKSDARFAIRNKQTLLGQGYFKKIEQMMKRPQTQKFSTAIKLNQYLSSQQLPEFKNIKYQSNIYLAKYMIQDCILSSKFFVLAKQFYFTIQYPYTCLFEGQNAYFLAIASNVPDKYYIIADKLYQQSSIDLLQAMKDQLEGNSFDSLFKNPKYNGKVISCPSFGKHIELPVTEGYAIFEFGLFWKDYLKGLRYIQQDKLHLQVISPFLFGLIGIQSGREIENLLCTIIDQKCLLK